MSVSKCHKNPVYVECGHEGMSYYVCSFCFLACDIVNQRNDILSDKDEINAADVRRVEG